MRDTDIPFAVSLTDYENWGYLPDDFRRLLSYEAAGCFVVCEGGESAGIVTTTSYDDFAFIGSLIVEEHHRGKGIGQALMSQAIEYLRGRGVKSMELDGVFHAVSLYRRLGFRDKYLSLRFMRKAQEQHKTPMPDRINNAEEIIAYDKAATGLDRSRVIREYFGEGSGAVYVEKKAEIRGYGIVRPRAGGIFGIGPVVCNDDSVGRQLMHRMVAGHGHHELEMGVPEINREAIEICRELGFEYRMPSLRMYRGDKRDYERNIYCIFSPEKG